MCAGMLMLQAVVLFLAGLVMTGTTDIGRGRARYRSRARDAVHRRRRHARSPRRATCSGWAVQVVSVALGFVVPMMFVLGAVFGALWAAAYYLGARIDREKAERALQEEQWQAEHGESTSRPAGTPR